MLELYADDGEAVEALADIIASAAVRRFRRAATHWLSYAARRRLRALSAELKEGGNCDCPPDWEYPDLLVAA
jgi:hypothetical protein